jgi:hypothetical protein
MRWTVKITYEKMNGDLDVKEYKVNAPTEATARYVAQRKLENLKSFKKTNSSEVVPLGS